MQIPLVHLLNPSKTIGGEKTPLTPSIKLSGKLQEVGVKDVLSQSNQKQSNDISVTDLDGGWDEENIDQKDPEQIKQKIFAKLKSEIFRIGGPEFEASGRFVVEQKWADIHELPGGINFNLLQNQERDAQNK